MRAPLLALSLSLATSALGLSARAEPLPEATARTRLAAFNDEIKRALGALAGGYGQDPAAEQRRIERAAQIAAGVEAALQDELASSPKALATVRENLRALQGEIERARLAQRYSAAEAAVRAKHKQGLPASDEEVRALTEALGALRARTGPGWQATLAHFDARAARLGRDRQQLAAASAKSAEAARNEGLLDAMRAANKERRTLERLLEDEPGPLPEPQLAAYLAAASKVSALSERAGRYYTTVYRQFLVANAFRAPDAEAFAKLANLYQGELVEHGSAKGKLSARLSAEEGWCYALLGRFERFSGAEGVSDLSWSATEKGASLVRFDVPHTGPGMQVTQGVCPSQATKLTVKASLEGAERSNALRFVVVGWPKESLPAFVTTYMRLYAEDRCDDEGWYRAWTRPVPGSLLYKGAEPMLVASAGRPPADELVLINVAGERVSAKKAEVSSKPPKERRFATAFGFSGCPAPKGAASPEADKLASCLQKVEKKYARSIEREEGWVERATSESAREKAQGRLDALKERFHNERVEQCDPLEARLREKVKRTFDRILDLHTDNEVIVSFDRADQLRAEQEAQPELR